MDDTDEFVGEECEALYVDEDGDVEEENERMANTHSEPLNIQVLPC